MHNQWAQTRLQKDEIHISSWTQWFDWRALRAIWNRITNCNKFWFAGWKSDDVRSNCKCTAIRATEMLTINRMSSGQRHILSDQLLRSYLLLGAFVIAASQYAEFAHHNGLNIEKRVGVVTDYVNEAHSIHTEHRTVLVDRVTPGVVRLACGPIRERTCSLCEMRFPTPLTACDIHGAFNYNFFNHSFILALVQLE